MSASLLSGRQGKMFLNDLQNFVGAGFGEEESGLLLTELCQRPAPACPVE